MSKIQKVKDHVKKYQTRYVVAGGTVVAVGAAGFFGYRVGVSRLVETQVNAKNQNVAAIIWKPKQTLEVHIEALGDPGNIIQDLTTGTIYASQNQAAKALDVSPWAVTKHLKGELPDAGGHQLVKLGKAMVPDSAS